LAGPQSWDLTQSDPRIVIGHFKGLPKEVKIKASNNCLSIAEFDDKLFIAWRSAPFHFASSKTKMYVMSSIDDGENWTYEYEVELGADVREPYLVETAGHFYLYFFQAGTDPIQFKPNHQKRVEYLGPQTWTDISDWGSAGEIHWQFNVENGTTYVSSYNGDHYSTELGTLSLYLNKTSDGVNFEPIQAEYPATVTNTGISEVGWMFDLFGNIWGVGRNEDGDASGWGGRIFHADWNTPGKWEFTAEQSQVDIYESPRMFRFGNELYLVARTDPTGHFWNKNGPQANLPRWADHYADLALYSLRPHSTAIWHVNTATEQLDKVADLPGCGDTAFPSILRTGKTTFRIANYSSPMDKCAAWPWIRGQVSPRGTQIHFIEIEFMAQE